MDRPFVQPQGSAFAKHCPANNCPFWASVRGALLGRLCLCWRSRAPAPMFVFVLAVRPPRVGARPQTRVGVSAGRTASARVRADRSVGQRTLRARRPKRGKILLLTLGAGPHLSRGRRHSCRPGTLSSGSSAARRPNWIF